MNSPYIRSALARKALELAPPLIRETLLGEPNFWKKYGFTIDCVLSFGDSGVSIEHSDFFNAVREILSGIPEKEVTDKKGQTWRLKSSGREGEKPYLLLSHGEQRLRLPVLEALSPDRNTRLHSFDKDTSDVNLPNSASDPWRNVLSGRALKDEEIDAFRGEFHDTPVSKARTIRNEIMGEQISMSSLVPSSRRYFERLVGAYDESASIHDYASDSGRKLFEQLSAWRPYDGFLYSLLLSSHASLTEEINVDQLNSEDLVRAFNFLDKQGDRISQLGAIEVGLRVFPSRPKIERILIRLIEKIRDDDVDGQTSDFKLLSALFCLVDGELSRTRLLSAEPPFYRRLAALSQASLIHRELVKSSLDIDPFSEWVSKNREEQHYLQSLVDMRLEPRWIPELAMASQMKADFFGRILITAKKYERNIKGSQIYDLIFGDEARCLQSLSNSLDPWFPGPLEGIEETQNILPPQVVEAIETQLSAKEVGPSSFPALVNFVLIYRIGTDQAELAAKTLKRTNHQLLNIEDRPQLVALLSGLATVAAVARSPVLANELRILVRKYRRDTKYELSVQEIIRICLVAAASYSELSKWTEFVGDWLTEFALGDLEDEEAQVFHSWLSRLCHVVPELWVSCGRADAALLALIYRRNR